MESWVIGVVMTLVGSTLSACGLMVQKYSHKLDQQQSSESNAHHDHGRAWDRLLPPAESLLQQHARWYFFSKWWLLGISVFIVGHIVTFLALGFGTQVMLSCLNVWTMVITFVIAPILLNEAVSFYKIVSVAVIVVGVILVLWYGSKTHEEYTVELFIDKMHDTTFACFTCFTVLSLAVLGASAFLRPPDDARLIALQYTVAAAMFAWYSVLCAKCASGFLMTSVLYRDNQYTCVVSWAVACATLVLAITNVHLMNMALKHGEGVFVVPVYESLSILGQVVLGGIFFNEFQDNSSSLTGRTWFWMGVFCVILGIGFLTGRAPESETTAVITPGCPVDPMNSCSHSSTTKYMAVSSC